MTPTSDCLLAIFSRNSDALSRAVEDMVNLSFVLLRQRPPMTARILLHSMNLVNRRVSGGLFNPPNPSANGRAALSGCADCTVGEAAGANPRRAWPRRWPLIRRHGRSPADRSRPGSGTTTAAAAIANRDDRQTVARNCSSTGAWAAAHLTCPGSARRARRLRLVDCLPRA